MSASPSLPLCQQVQPQVCCCAAFLFRCQLKSREWCEGASSWGDAFLSRMTVVVMQPPCGDDDNREWHLAACLKQQERFGPPGLASSFQKNLYMHTLSLVWLFPTKLNQEGSCVVGCLSRISQATMIPLDIFTYNFRKGLEMYEIRKLIFVCSRRKENTQLKQRIAVSNSYSAVVLPLSVDLLVNPEFLIMSVYIWCVSRHVMFATSMPYIF